MKSLFFNCLFIRCRRGQAIVFAPFMIIGVLLLGGVSIDILNVVLSNAKLQRALDAGTMSGITRYASGITETTAIEEAAESLVRHNLNVMGVSDGQISQLDATMTVDENRVATLKIDCVYDSPTFFVRMMPGEDLDQVEISGTATSRRIPAMISLVLDISGSMQGQKLESLKEAAITFISFFEDGLDSMAIILFSYEAEVLYPMSLVNKEAMEDIIEDISAYGNTNIAHSLVLARKEIENADNDYAVKAIVAFTDGAPNSIRSYFRDGRHVINENYPWEDPVYFDYIVEGTSRRVKEPGTLDQVCSRFNFCFTSFAYFDSRLNLMPGSEAVDHRSQYEILLETFDLAVHEADYAKTDGVTVFTIGLGHEDPVTDNAYQDPYNWSSLKAFLLRRLANDPASAQDPQFPEFPNNPRHPGGLYLQTPDPDELTSLFETVALKLKVRLVA